jgi:hypothetical protein
MMVVRAQIGRESVAVLAMRDGSAWLVRRGPGGLFPHTWTLPSTVVEPGEWVDDAAARLLGNGRGDARQIARIEQTSPLSEDRGPTRIYLIEAQNNHDDADQSQRSSPGRWASRADMEHLLMLREARECIVSLLEPVEEADQNG